jgi:nicotinamide phosphoribosyltransferase
MSKLTSIMTNTDSYKGSMFKQYPPGTEYVYSYIESRGGKYDKTVFLGIQAFLKQVLTKRITQEQIDFAEKLWTAHGMPFNREGWEYILNEHGGKLPVTIRAAKEGLVIPTKNVLATIVNTDPKCFWLTTWIETALLRAIWYPTTVGTISWHIKQVIKAYLEKSGDVAGLPFKLHDFGARGVSSEESANIGGYAHLVNFMGSDTLSALPFIMENYGADMNAIGYSIPAAEHSTITSWGKADEVSAYRNMVAKFGKKDAILAVVSDSYDIYAACEMWGTVLKDEVVASEATVVIRPDSGDPVVVLPKMMKILGEKFGYYENVKGYKVLNNVRVIWGDGINAVSLSSILRVLVDVGGWSADNFAFGMGGGLLQQCDRDTLQFAMKCSAVGIRMHQEGDDPLGGEEGYIDFRDVFKDPITASNKASKKGLVQLWDNGAGEYQTSVNQPMNWSDKGFSWQEALETVFMDGELYNETNFEKVRANSNL